MAEHAHTWPLAGVIYGEPDDRGAGVEIRKCGCGGEKRIPRALGVFVTTRNGRKQLVEDAHTNG